MFANVCHISRDEFLAHSGPKSYQKYCRRIFFFLFAFSRWNVNFYLESSKSIDRHQTKPRRKWSSHRRTGFYILVILSKNLPENTLGKIATKMCFILALSTSQLTCIEQTCWINHSTFSSEPYCHKGKRMLHLDICYFNVEIFTLGIGTYIAFLLNSSRFINWQQKYPFCIGLYWNIWFPSL